MTADSAKRTGEGMLEDIMYRLQEVERRQATFPAPEPIPPIPPFTPVGIGFLWFGSAVPTSEYIFARGQSLLRADYVELSTIFLSIYGSVDGTHFNVPDLRQRFPIGLDSAGPTATNTLNKFGGTTQETLTEAQIPAHDHDLQNFSQGGFPAGLGVNAWYPGGGTVTTDSTGGGGAHNNMPPFRVVDFIIKAL